MLGGRRTGGKARGTARGDVHGPVGQHQAEVEGRHRKAALTFGPLAEGGGAEQGQQQQPGTHPRQGGHPLPPETHGTLKSRGSEGSVGETAQEEDSCSGTALCALESRSLAAISGLSRAEHEIKSESGSCSMQACARGSKSPRVGAGRPLCRGRLEPSALHT